MRAVAIALCVLALSACKKADEGPKPPAAAPAPAAPAVAAPKVDGPRVIAIEAGKEGYVPDKIAAKPNEKLRLVFTRTFDSECLAQVKLPDGVVHELPMNTPVELALTMPKEGKVTFACGMDMLTGEIVADVN